MKKIIIIFLLILTGIGLCSCVGRVDEMDKASSSEKKPESSVNPSEPTENTKEFTVCLKYDDNIYIPAEEIIVTWYNDVEQKNAKIGADGYARIQGLDGDYSIHLSATPESTTYNPNIYKATNDSPHVEIELLMLLSPTGTGANLYTQICKIGAIGTYHVNLNKQNPEINISSYKYRDNQKGILYYEFHPKESGTYYIESIADLYEDSVNPIIISYGYAQSSMKNTANAKIINDGGASKSGGYTKNFKFEVSFSSEELRGSNVYAFAIIAQSKTEEYPISFDFEIKFKEIYEPAVEDEAQMMHVSEEMKACFRDRVVINENGIEIKYFGEAKSTYPLSMASVEGNTLSINGMKFTIGEGKLTDKDGKSYFLYEDSSNKITAYAVNSNWFGTYLSEELHKTMNASEGAHLVRNLATAAPGSEYKLLSSKLCVYNEEDGFWHYNTINGPILCMYVTQTSDYIGEPLNHIEDPGNNALTIFNGKKKENYREYFYIGNPGMAYGGELSDGCQYYCNSDGICYLTMELKKFLQNFSVSSRYFMDGNGWMETQHKVYASEEDQWLWDCCYYTI